jgi:hypothetical protein
VSRGLKLWDGRIVGATIRAIVEGGTRLQVSYGQETALIYLWQIVEEGSLIPRTWEQGGPGRDVVRSLFLLEVAAGLEPAKTGFADQRLGHFGIATSKRSYSRYTQTVPKLPPQRLFTPTLVPAIY